MMSPYEAERFFEAEMARSHQFDADLYRFRPDPARVAVAQSQFSLRAWLAARLTSRNQPAGIAPATSQTHLA